MINTMTVVEFLTWATENTPEFILTPPSEDAPKGGFVGAPAGHNTTAEKTPEQVKYEAEQMEKRVRDLQCAYHLLVFSLAYSVDKLDSTASYLRTFHTKMEETNTSEDTSWLQNAALAYIGSPRNPILERGLADSFSTLDTSITIDELFTGDSPWMMRLFMKKSLKPYYVKFFESYLQFSGSELHDVLHSVKHGTAPTPES